MIEHIKGLAEKKMSREGYTKLISLLHHFIYKYNWPKSVLDEVDHRNPEWNQEEIISFTHQFVMYLFDRNKLKNIEKIPDEYLDYYFHQIIMTYVSDKIKKTQKEQGISYQTLKRIVKEILENDFIDVKIETKKYWTMKDIYENKILSNENIQNLVDHLPKIPINADTKHYKPLIKKGMDLIFSVTESAIEENYLVQLTYSLFDQSYFVSQLDNEEADVEIDHVKIDNIISKIIKEISIEDIPLIMKYYFNDNNYTLSDIAKEFSIPKSTTHYRIEKFKNILNSNYVPQNREEGVYFLEKLYEKLDEIK